MHIAKHMSSDSNSGKDAAKLAMNRCTNLNVIKMQTSNVSEIGSGKDVVRLVAASFVVIFSFVHLLDAIQRKEICEKGYFATLTVFTLLLTAYVTVARSPPALVAAVLAINVVVCALYYGVVNQSYVGGTSFLLHGGCALVLVALVWCGCLDCKAHPAIAAVVCVALLGFNALLQITHERRSSQSLYPSCDKFENPLWRTVVIPGVGGALAAFFALVAGLASR
jgi:hypothetical protein